MDKKKEKSKVKIDIRIDIFKQMYYELKDRIDTDDDIFTRDITHLIPIYYKQKIKEGTLINIALRGEPGSGKSIVALQEMWTVNRLLDPKFDLPLQHIASDQGELIRLAKSESYKNSCIEVDEFNPLLSTGANATTELKEYEFFTDLCRVYYIHRISCSPIRIADPNVNVVFDVISKDAESKKTFIKILYRNSLESRWVQLGVAWINVKEVLESNWYKLYENKKLQRINLLTKHGLRDLRELEFNHVSMKIIKDISNILDAMDLKTELEALIRMKAINYMQDIYQRPISFIAEDEIVKPSRAILQLLHTIGRLMKRKNEDNAVRTEQVINVYKEELDKAWSKMQEKEDVYKKYKELTQ